MTSTREHWVPSPSEKPHAASERCWCGPDSIDGGVYHKHDREHVSWFAVLELYERDSKTKTEGEP